MDGSRNKTPLEELPDYVAVADDRHEAVRTWAAKYVEDAHIELVTKDPADLERAKRNLRAALHILETEID